jgi:sterol desaturase/sphingolipid hydroxylase (fatty acid hydroxylase superfamily)
MTFLCGLLAWTLVEYLLHRFAFHAPTRFLGRRHIAHHADVSERALTPAKWQPVLMVAIAGLGGAHALFGRAGVEALAGLLVGYALYEVTHYAVHYWKLEADWFRALKRYHLSHHFQSPRARFGVTSPVWDIVFGTFRVPERKR